ncbi:MAG: hypothetical protein NE328_02715 [Lentisphaeraceae bacterium]|nr:hypothetical protein [Lentisphaeraceae bacterium]
MNALQIDPLFMIQQHDEKLLRKVTSPATSLETKEEYLEKADARQLENIMVYLSELLDLTAEELAERTSESVSIHIDHYASKPDYIII